MEIDLRELETRQAHDLLTGSIIPRPIAWVLTVDAQNAINLAPFSFFTGVCWQPPTLAFSVANRDDGTKKDTLINIEAVGEFVVHTVSVELIRPMEISAGRIPPGEDLHHLQGVTFAPSATIRPPRIVEAKVAFECVLDRIVTIGDGAGGGNLILGRIQRMHAADDLVTGGREIDWRKLNPLGRLSGNRYCDIRSVIEVDSQCH